MAEDAKPRLGRGLAALIGEVGGRDVASWNGPRQTPVPVEFLRPNPRNPRKYFDDRGARGALRTRSAIAGIIQPIVVRPLPGKTDAYRDRRRRAPLARRAAWRVCTTCRSSCVDIDDKTSLEYAILENVQRADLNPIEEAQGYSRLMAEFSYTQENLAKIIGKSRSHIANMMRLSDLPETVKTLLVNRQITAGHGRALLGEGSASGGAAHRRPWHERPQVEEIAQADQTMPRNLETKSAHKPSKDPDTRALERALQDVLGLNVEIDHKGKGGELRIRYKTLEQLDGLCRRLNPQ